MTRLTKLRWAFNRLVSMSPPEIAHRIKERRSRSSGRSMSGWEHFKLENVQLEAFKFDPENLRLLHEACGDDWASVWELLRNERWHFLGVDWPGPQAASVVWHLDPVSQSAWPSDPYCFDVDFRHQHTLGDVKYVWELNRLQFLPPIAAWARGTRNDVATRYCVDTILGWADANPPFKGVNWASGIELALRAISILATISIIGPESLSAQDKDRIGTILNAHAVWLMRFPSLYSSANNHLIAEAAGLYVLGALVPSLPDAAQYRAYGRSVLIAEAEKQIHADGVGAEQSPTYTAFVLEFYATVLAVAPIVGDTFPPVVGERLGAALQFLRWITDDNGNQPRFGDDDEGRVIISQPDFEKYYVASIMGGLSVATGRAELAPPVAVPHLRDLFLGSAAIPGAAPTGLRSFDDGGYSVFRQPVQGHDVMLAFDHGPLGYLSIAAHGHADALAVWLHVDGQPVIIDAGTYLYHAGGADRDRFRGTGAHNTLLVNDTDQSTIVGAFNWSHKAKSWRVPAVGAGDARQVTARHDGYLKSLGVVHERQVELSDTGFAISDRLEGALTAITDTSIHYYLDPSITPSLDKSGTITLSRDRVAILEISVRATAGEILTPELVETDVSPQFGTKSRTHAIRFTVPKHLWAAGGPVCTTMRFV